MAPTWRDKGYHRRDFSKIVFQVKENISQSGAKCPTLWTVSPRMRGTDKPAISFTDEEAERIHHPHDDAIVITLLIADYTTRRVLVDNGSSANILYYPTF